MQKINWDELEQLLPGLVVTQEVIGLLRELDKDKDEYNTEYEYSSAWRRLANDIARLIELPKDHGHEQPGVLINTIRNLRPFLERKYIIQERGIAPGRTVTLKGRKGIYTVKKIGPQFFVILEGIKNRYDPTHFTVLK